MYALGDKRSRTHSPANFEPIRGRHIRVFSLRAPAPRGGSNIAFRTAARDCILENIRLYPAMLCAPSENHDYIHHLRLSFQYDTIIKFHGPLSSKIRETNEIGIPECARVRDMEKDGRKEIL